VDIEFHYYIMYLIATRAGFDPKSAYTIAYASQFVDDNVISYKLDANHQEQYKNYISQTINILKPEQKLFRIYPLFHFIPGEIFEGCPRKDGKLHYLNTTPDSKNARNILKAATKTRNLYRIGIASHAYADTWAHQNFTGYYDEFNVLKEPLQRPWELLRYFGIPIGHVSALHNPDRINRVWDDCRLVKTKRDNKIIFAEAIGNLFEFLSEMHHSHDDPKHLETEKQQLINDIQTATQSPSKDERVKNYIILSQKEIYGKHTMKSYDSFEWMNEAVSENLKGLRFKGKNIVLKFLLTYISSKISLFNQHTWNNVEKYKDTRWYQFQEAVKDHQKESTMILNETNISQLQLNKW